MIELDKCCNDVWNHYIDDVYEGDPDDELEQVQECKEWLEQISLWEIAEICPEYCDYKDPDDVEAAAEEIVNRMLKGLDKAEDMILQQEYPLCSMK